jgi:hypothetical protein
MVSGSLRRRRLDTNCARHASPKTLVALNVLLLTQAIQQRQHLDAAVLMELAHVMFVKRVLVRSMVLVLV